MTKQLRRPAWLVLPEKSSPIEFRLLAFRARDYYAIPEIEEGALGRTLCGPRFARIELVLDDDTAVTTCATLLVPAAYVGCHPDALDLDQVLLRRSPEGIRREIHSLEGCPFTQDDITQLTPILMQSMSKLMEGAGNVPPLVRTLMDLMSAEARKAKVPGLFVNSLAGSMIAACRSPMAQRLAVRFGDQDIPATGITEGSGQTPFAIAQWLSGALDASC